MFYCTFFGKFIIDVSKLLSANYNIWVILGSVFIFSTLIMDYTIYFFAGLVILYCMLDIIDDTL